jgi:hypothetical protein
MNIFRRVVPVAIALALPACSGSGGGLGNIFGGNPQSNYCQPGTQVQVVSPAPFQFDSNVNQVTVVANGSNDNIHPDPQNWSLNVVGNFGGAAIPGSNFNPVDGSHLDHPFGSDFYYQSQLPQTLPSGVTWSVYLQQNNSNCQPVPLQSFST